jgi:hypothetical protein
MALIKRIDRNGSLYMTWVEIYAYSWPKCKLCDHEPTKRKRKHS